MNHNQQTQEKPIVTEMDLIKANETPTQSLRRIRIRKDTIDYIFNHKCKDFNVTAKKKNGVLRETCTTCDQTLKVYRKLEAVQGK